MSLQFILLSSVFMLTQSTAQRSVFMQPRDSRDMFSSQQIADIGEFESLLQRDMMNPVLQEMARKTVELELEKGFGKKGPTGGKGPIRPGTKIGKKVIRKEYRAMTDVERTKFHNAIVKLYAGGKTSNTWHKFSLWHVGSMRSAHRGPAFLGWHRHMLKLVEDALQEIDPDIAMPYWDSHLDGQLPNPEDSIIWTADFMGTPNGVLSEGPFANFKGVTGARVRRAVSRRRSLPQPRQVQYVVSRKRFQDLVFCHDSTFEAMHDLVHLFVGGDMVTAHSPDDPVFYLHHTYIDKLWEDMRKKSQTTNAETDYNMDRRNFCRSQHSPSSSMKPWAGLTNIAGLSNKYTENEYTYADVPSCQSSSANCGSKYLFCDTSRKLCLPKIRMGGVCVRLERYNPCYKGVCNKGRCAAISTNSTTSTTTTTTTTTTITTTSTTTVAVPANNPISDFHHTCDYTCNSQFCRHCCQSIKKLQTTSYCHLCQRQIRSHGIAKCTDVTTRDIYSSFGVPRNPPTPCKYKCRSQMCNACCERSISSFCSMCKRQAITGSWSSC